MILSCFVEALWGKVMLNLEEFGCKWTNNVDSMVNVEILDCFQELPQ